MGLKARVFETCPGDAGRCPALTDVSLTGKESPGKIRFFIPCKGYIYQRWVTPIAKTTDETMFRTCKG